MIRLIVDEECGNLGELRLDGLEIANETAQHAGVLLDNNQPGRTVIEVSPIVQRERLVALLEIERGDAGP